MNAEQQAIFNNVTGRIQNAEQVIMFISGTAGTGKSFLISNLRDHFRFTRKLGVFLAAPTGIAAKALGGETLHRLFGIPTRGPFDPKIVSRNRNVVLLIIDEISMVGAELFEKINLAMKAVAGNDREDFGGISVLMFGDLMQIPPIESNWIFTNPLWQKRVEYSELLQNMRQATDPIFAERLGRWRVGRMTLDDFIWIFSRDIANKIGKKGESALKEWLAKNPEGTTLSLLNRDVTEFNDFIVKLEEPEKVAEIEQYIIRDSDQCPELVVSSRFPIAIGSRVMVTRNLENGLRNGETLTILDFNTDIEGKVVSVTIDLFNDQTCTLTHSVWTDENGQQMKDIPIALAHSMTYHKAQGSTLQNVLLHSRHRLPPALFFVGASRVQRGEQLHVNNSLLFMDLMVDSSALSEYNRLRASIGLPSV